MPTARAGVTVQQFIEFVARQLAESPDQVEVTETVEDSTTIYRLKVAPEDMGRIIGRQGRVVRAMRVLLRAAAARQGLHVALEVKE